MDEQETTREQTVSAEPTAGETSGEAPTSQPERSEAAQYQEKYVRLYAEFENYKRRVSRDKEELLKYRNEELLNALLPAVDNLELALKHGAVEPKGGLVEGVEMTMKELQRVLEKFGLTRIDAVGKAFDPAVHHAMAQVERADLEEKMVAEELRSGYLYFDKVLRPSLVAVSVRPKGTTGGDG